MSGRTLVALDIGSTKVACAIGRAEDHGTSFELLGASLVPYPTLSEAFPGDPAMVGRTIAQALEATGVSASVQEAAIAFSHPSLTAERVRAFVDLSEELVPVRERDLGRLRDKALGQVLGVDREPLLVERLGCSGNGFTDVRQPVGLAATRLTGTFQVVTVPTAVRRTIVQAAEAAGLDVAQLSFSLPAVAAALDTAQQAPRVLLLDVGGLQTDLGLFEDGRLHRAHTISSGGLTLAWEVARSLRLTLEQAATLSLQGLSSRKPVVRAPLEQQMRTVQRAIDQLLKGCPQPEAALVTGRGSLIDGFAERLEALTGLKTSVARSPRAHAMGELSRQVGLTAAVGLLELGLGRGNGAPASPHPVDRLILRTKALLAEYF